MEDSPTNCVKGIYVLPQITSLLSRRTFRTQTADTDWATTPRRWGKMLKCFLQLFSVAVVIQLGAKEHSSSKTLYNSALFFKTNIRLYPSIWFKGIFQRWNLLFYFRFSSWWWRLVRWILFQFNESLFFKFQIMSTQSYTELNIRGHDPVFNISHTGEWL